MDELGATGGAVGAVEVNIDSSGVPLIKLSGEIDMSNVDSMQGTIAPVLEISPPRVDFDLTELRFMDSSGIALLLRVAAKAGAVHLRGCSALVRRMIEVTGLTDVFVVEP